MGLLRPAGQCVERGRAEELRTSTSGIPPGPRRNGWPQRIPTASSRAARSSNWSADWVPFAGLATRLCPTQSPTGLYLVLFHSNRRCHNTPTLWKGRIGDDVVRRRSGCRSPVNESLIAHQDSLQCRVAGGSSSPASGGVGELLAVDGDRGSVAAIGRELRGLHGTGHRIRNTGQTGRSIK